MSRNNKQIVKEINTPSLPSAGTSACAGKRSADQEDSLRKRKLPKASKAENAKEVAGKTLDCVETQVGQNANPKKRDASSWGVSREVIKTAKKLT